MHPIHKEVNSFNDSFCFFKSEKGREEWSSQLADLGHHTTLQGSQVLLYGVSRFSCYKSQQGSDTVMPQYRPSGDLSVLLHADTLLRL